MSFIKCYQCVWAISNKADNYPQRGAKLKKKTSVLTWLILFIITISVYGVVTSNDSSSFRKVTTSNSQTKVFERLYEYRDLAKKTMKIFLWNRGNSISIFKISSI